MAKTDTNPSDPKPLSDADLAEVSGGAIPDRLMAYVDLLPNSYKKSLLAALNDPNLDERVFVTRLEAALKSNGFTHEYYDVVRYEKFGR